MKIYSDFDKLRQRTGGRAPVLSLFKDVEATNEALFSSIENVDVLRLT